MPQSDGGDPLRGTRPVQVPPPQRVIVYPTGHYELRGDGIYNALDLSAIYLSYKTADGRGICPTAR